MADIDLTALGVPIKAAYELQANTEVFTTAFKDKLTNVAIGATANTGALANKDTVGTADIDNLSVTAAKLEDSGAVAGIYTSVDITVDAKGRITAVANGVGGGGTGGFTQEEIEDFIGAMFTGNTTDRITITYQDTDGTIDVSVDPNLANYDNSTSGFLTGYTVTQLDVTAHQAALTILEAQISDLGAYLTSLTGETLGSLGDVLFTGLADQHIIKYDSASGKFINAAGGAGGGITWTTPVDGNITFATHDTWSIGSATKRAKLISTVGLDLNGVLMDGTTLDDPGATRLLGWDAVNNLTAYFDIGTGLSFSGTTLSATAAPVTTISRNPQIGIAYPLVLTDAGKKVTMDNAAANTLTVPDNATVPFPVDTVLGVTQIGAGITSITAAAGVTINGVTAGTASIIQAFTGVTLTNIGTNTWIAEGNIGDFA